MFISQFLFQSAWVFTILACLQMTTGFLTANNQCFDVCACPSKFDINCNSRALQTFPVFDLPAEFWTTFHLNVRLDHNILSEIPFGVFRNFTHCQRYKVIYLLLQNNHISEIRYGAFLGLEHLSVVLHLENNNLTYISHEFTQFRGLHQLYIERNPLVVTGIPDDVIRQMFSYNELGTVNLGSYELLKKVMKYQQNRINTLRMIDMNQAHFDHGLFVKGHATNLKYLDIYNCAFSDYSEILCNLALGRLSLIRCQKVNDTTLQGCHQHLANALHVIDCGTTDAFDPSAFYSAPLTELTLRGNISHVPQTLLHHWPQIRTITLTGHIRGIQREDFKGLSELRHLSISGDTSITYVDNEAFNTNLKLEQLSILNYDTFSQLTPSIKHLTNLKQLVLPDMLCTCVSMGDLKGGNYSSVDIRGNCKYSIPGQSIKAYLQYNIIACP